MEENDPPSVKSPQKSRLYIKLASILVVIVAIIAGLAIASHKNSNTLESVAYMQKNCPTVVPVNVSADYPTNNNSGITLLGKRGMLSVKHKSRPIVTYTWHLPKRDKFCGIVGTTYGPVYKSLKPTSETAHGGTYVDTSPQNPPLKQIGEFFVYARPQ